MDAGGSDPHCFLSPTGHHLAGCIQLPAGLGLLWVMFYVDGAPELGNQVALQGLVSNSFLSPAPGSGKLTSIQVTLIKEPAEGYMGILRGQPKKLHRRAESPKLQPSSPPL